MFEMFKCLFLILMVHEQLKKSSILVCLALENCRQTIVFICDPSFVASSLCMHTYIDQFLHTQSLFSDLCCDDGLFAVDVEDSPCNNLIAMLLGLAFSRSCMDAACSLLCHALL